MRSNFTAMYFPQSILFRKKMSNYHHKNGHGHLKPFIDSGSTVVTYSSERLELIGSYEKSFPSEESVRSWITHSTV